MSNQHNDFLDSDCNDQIRLNVFHRRLALDSASDLLKASKHSISLNPELPDSDLVVSAHALLTYQQYESGHPDGFQRSLSSSMAAITEKLAGIAESIDCAGVKVSLIDKVVLTALTGEQALTALKEHWLNLHKEYTDQEYREVISEFEKLLGL